MDRRAGRCGGVRCWRVEFYTLRCHAVCNAAVKLTLHFPLHHRCGFDRAHQHSTVSVRTINTQINIIGQDDVLVSIFLAHFLNGVLHDLGNAFAAFGQIHRLVHNNLVKPTCRIGNGGYGREGNDVQVTIHRAHAQCTDGKMLNNTGNPSGGYPIPNLNGIFRQHEEAGDNVFNQALRTKGKTNTQNTGTG